MTKAYKLTKTQQLVDVGTKLSQHWFRGHAVACDELTPRIFRGEYNNEHTWRGGLEQPMIEDFKRGAPGLMSTSPPPDDDHVSWLFLMQHHGMPTRLLDWTESALMAMYFAVSECQNQDGEMWAMRPEMLNEKSGEPGIFLPRHGIVKYLAAEPSWKKLDILATRCGLTEPPWNPVALRPPMNFNRMVAQLSTFTIHPKPKPKGRGTTIPELLEEPEHLVRYVVPAKDKESIRRDLAALGITRRSLFPDLDGLSASIVYARKVGPYSPQGPPHSEEE